MQLKSYKLISVLFIGIFFVFSCNDKEWFISYYDIGQEWDSAEEAKFKFQNPPEDKANIYILLRNDQKYQFSNIFLIASINQDGKTIISDTLEYEMAEKSGKFLGKGYGPIKESKLYWKEDFMFSSESKYSISIRNAMRKSQEQFGIKTLPGIIGVGISIDFNEE